MTTILIVDDDAHVLEMPGCMVSDLGYEVVKPKSGLEALDFLDRGDALDLPLTDVVMPGLNGFMLAPIARMRRRSLAVIHQTGNHDQALVRLGKGVRCGRTLRKPIDADVLRKELGAALVRPTPDVAFDA